MALELEHIQLPALTLADRVASVTLTMLSEPRQPAWYQHPASIAAIAGAAVMLGRYMPEDPMTTIEKCIMQ